MGIISDFKAMKDVNRIKKGGTAKLSISQITGLIINLPDAQRNLSPKEFNEVYNLFRNLRTCKTKIQMDVDGYLQQAIEIVKRFDAIAPYQKYSGGNELEFSFLVDDLRRKESTINVLNDVYYNDEEVEEYARYLMKEATFSIEYEDALEFSQLLHRYTVVGKEETMEKFFEFNKRFFEKFGDISPIAITMSSYFMGALNANGIISDEELDEMSANLISSIRDIISKQ